MTTDMPMVCDTEAAGLGVLGVVIGWAKPAIAAIAVMAIAKYFLIIMCFYPLIYEKGSLGLVVSF